MDQDSFRLLLNSSKPSSGRNVTQSKAYNRGSLLASGTSSTKQTETPQAAFKPRKVKKAVDSKYRDRAAERRGGANEYAEVSFSPPKLYKGNKYDQVEGLLEDFEKRMEGEKREVVDEQRKYLGGDATHTVLVKGLDFALLEQQRAREESRDDLDDVLESAFQGEPVEAPSTEEPSTTTQTQGKKRTRAELLAELKQSREASAGQVAKTSKEEEVEALERAKQAGKFKPMGSSSFAPVEKKKKKKKATVEEGKPQAKATPSDPSGVGNKLSSPANVPSQESVTATPTENVTTAQKIDAKSKADPPIPSVPPALAPIPAPPTEEIEDADPFADAGEYEPDYGDDNSDAEDAPKDTQQAPSVPGRRNWFNEPEPVPEPEPARPPTPPPKTSEETEPEPGPSRSTRLEGLSSSAMPSISEYLAMDKDEEARERKKARKEKNKNKKKDA